MVAETIRFLSGVVLFCFVLFGAATLLTGCSRDDLKYAECFARDNTSRPCN